MRVIVVWGCCWCLSAPVQEAQLVSGTKVNEWVRRSAWIIDRSNFSENHNSNRLLTVLYASEWSAMRVLDRGGTCSFAGHEVQRRCTFSVSEWLIEVLVPCGLTRWWLCRHVVIKEERKADAPRPAGVGCKETVIWDEDQEERRCASLDDDDNNNYFINTLFPLLLSQCTFHRIKSSCRFPSLSLAMKQDKRCKCYLTCSCPRGFHLHINWETRYWCYSGKVRK